MGCRQPEIGKATHLLEGRDAIRVAVDHEAAEQDHRADPERRSATQDRGDREGNGARGERCSEDPYVLGEDGTGPDLIAGQVAERHDRTVRRGGEDQHDNPERGEVGTHFLEGKPSPRNGTRGNRVEAAPGEFSGQRCRQRHDRPDTKHDRQESIGSP